ncbi:hypothetical protein EBME_0384 [bacterium endosymbiont of Mortierella elongata FMR23-6]|nr:hypothetical protein EBME_0384 [bacterium endosymbiont of Mortierella elongata FMR23-6]
MNGAQRVATVQRARFLIILRRLAWGLVLSFIGGSRRNKSFSVCVKIDHFVLSNQAMSSALTITSCAALVGCLPHL